MARKSRKGNGMRNPNGYGSVVTLSGNRRKKYEVRVNTRIDDRGYPKYDVIGRYEERSAAMIALAEYNKDPYDVAKSNLTFKEVYTKYYDRKYNGVKKLSKSSMNCTRSAFNKCVSLHDKKMADITSEHMQAILDNYDLSHATMEHIKNLFNQMYAYAMEFDIVKKDWSRFIRITKDDDDEHGIPFTLEELSLLWQNKDEPFVDTILIYIYSGWRINELLKMPIENVDLAERTYKGGIKTRAGKDRIVPIHSKIFDMVKRRALEGFPVLIGHKSKPITDIGTYHKLFHEALDTAGVTTYHTPHDARHTFATLLDNAGANPTSIKRLLGHSTGGDITKIYTHKDIEELRKAIELI